MTGGQKMVAVAGATGRTGRLIVHELLQRGFPVRALVRSASAASQLRDQGAEIAEVDIASPESLERALQGAAYVISALGSKKPFSAKENNRVDNLGNRNVAAAARAQGVQHIVVISSVGVGDSRYAINFIFRLLMGPVLRMKEKSEESIKKCGVPYTIIRPGGLSDKDLSGSVAFGEGGKLMGMVSRKDIARVCVDALTSKAMRNRVLEVVDTSTVKDALKPFIINI